MGEPDECKGSCEDEIAQLKTSSEHELKDETASSDAEDSAIEGDDSSRASAVTSENHSGHEDTRYEADKRDGAEEHEQINDKNRKGLDGSAVSVTSIEKIVATQDDDSSRASAVSEKHSGDDTQDEGGKKDVAEEQTIDNNHEDLDGSAGSVASVGKVATTQQDETANETSEEDGKNYNDNEKTYATKDQIAVLHKESVAPVEEKIAVTINTKGEVLKESRTQHEEVQEDEQSQNLPSVPLRHKTPKKRASKPKPVAYVSKSGSGDQESNTLHQSSLFCGPDDAFPKPNAFKDKKGPDTPKDKVDLLANFVTYTDQRSSVNKNKHTPVSTAMRHSIPAPKSSRKMSAAKARHSTPLVPRTEYKHRPLSASKDRHAMTEPRRKRPATSPLPKSGRHPGLDKRRSTPEATYSSRPCNPEDYDIPRSSIKRRSILSPKTPESQRAEVNAKRRSEVGLIRNHAINGIKTDIPPRQKDFPRSQMALSIMSAVVALFCALSIAARCLTFIGGKRALFYYMAESPVVWTLRFYILVLHAVMILVECKIIIPNILPRGTLSNYVQRAFMLSLVGLLDICLNFNRSVVEGTNDGIWLQIAYAVLQVAPRGLIVCACLYFTSAVFGENGRSAFNRKFNRAQMQ